MYVLIDQTGAVKAYPYSVAQLRKDNPDTSIPKSPSGELLAGFGVHPVVDTPAPATTDTEKAYHTGNAVLVNGQWQREWAVRDKTAAELAQEREQRKTQVISERVRRLALGFNYDFGDARGVHRIGTTEGDMTGWDEVTSWANAMLALGNTATTITIVTDTGPAEVTAQEWQGVLAGAAAFRQPIWGASFVLMNMDPIPDPKTWEGWPV